MTLTLTADIDAGVSSFPMSGAPTFTVRPFLAQVESEQVLVLAAGGTNWGPVLRAQNGTSASAHVSTTVVSPVFAVTSAGESAGGTEVPLSASNLLDLRASAAAAGDSRSIYTRLYFATAGASGEALRAYGLVTAAAAGTVNGAHLSLMVNTGGSITGAAHAIRGTFESDASVNVGGTASVLHLDTSFGTSATPSPLMAFISFDNLGTPKPKLLFNITNPDTTATSGMFIAAGTGGGSAGASGGAVASNVLRISIAGTPYWIPLCNTNS